MEFERIDALAARIVRVQFRLMSIGQIGEYEHVRLSEREAIAGQRIGVPARAFALDGRDQRGIGGEGVVAA